LVVFFWLMFFGWQAASIAISADMVSAKRYVFFMIVLNKKIFCKLAHQHIHKLAHYFGLLICPMNKMLPVALSLI
jgi:hypothetical protein